jgi:prepilin signal peptidase PulO-like enzyme (type II secretory pathway)
LALLLLGSAVGGLLNLAVYTLAWNRRPISPWSPSPAGAAPRRWPDRIPVLGWFFLRREQKLLGRGFWVRPLGVELLSGLVMAGLYWWEVEAQALVGAVQVMAPPPGVLVHGDLPWVLHSQFGAHAILFLIMVAASLIDLDEQTIPDGLTIPGALAGLALAAALPWSLLPAEIWLADGALAIEFLTLASPTPWPAVALAPRPPGPGLALALGCWTLWCAGMLPRRWNTTRGWRMAVRVLVHRLRAERFTYLAAVMWLAGMAAIALFAWQADTAHWAALLSALVGLAAGGGMIWVVRFIGTAALQREAMGFGDVMLMSMIGTFLGWQGALLVFFLGPFFGLISGLAQWVVHRQNELPYGPYLCLAACLVVVQWPALWAWSYDFFAMGGLLLAVFALCLVMMGCVLWIYRLARERFLAS